MRWEREPKETTTKEPKPPPPPRVVVREAPVGGRTRRVLETRPRPPRLGRRYAVVYDLAGPRIRLAVGWFVLVVAAVVVGIHATAVLYAFTAGWAGLQAADAWRDHGIDADRWSAAVGAGALVLAADLGAGLFGLAVLGLVIAASIVALSNGERARHRFIQTAGTTLQSGLFVGMAGASLILAFRMEIGAAAILVVLVSMYEAGDYLVGSGSSNAVEGPVAGIVAVMVATLVVAVLNVPPFRGADAWTWGVIAAILCPLGQLAGSAVLPAADARAPALRRLDSLLVLAPAWAASVALYLEHLSD